MNLSKRNQRRTIIQILSIYANTISKNVGCYERNYWKQRVTNGPFPNHIKVKNREIFGKKIAETFNWFFLNNDPNLAAPIPKSKTTFQNYIHHNGPCLSTINFTDLELENEFGSFKINKSSGYNDISVGIVKRVSDEILFF